MLDHALTITAHSIINLEYKHITIYRSIIEAKSYYPHVFVVCTNCRQLSTRQLASPFPKRKEVVSSLGLGVMQTLLFSVIYSLLSL